MLVTESRPRDLRWIHAGPLLYGDWGTSRLYVLGLAFLYTAHASIIYLAAIGLLMLAVSWAYTVVCRCFPDGGGVYTAARQLSPTASVVGATLLLSGYIMTAAISVVEAFHYFGVPDTLTLPLSAVTIGLIGVVNWLGARSAGRFALFVAFAALGVSAVMAVACLPFFLRGVRGIDLDYFTVHASPADAWVSFTRICLALAGVEAVANMTGLMRHPVATTAKRTIWPVTIEVVALNLVFGLALTGLAYPVAGVPLAEQSRPHELLLEDGELDPQAAEAVDRYTAASMKVIAEQAGDYWAGAHSEPAPSPSDATQPAAAPPATTPPDTAAPTAPAAPAAPTDPHHARTAVGFAAGKVAGITFGLLLLSATNTAVMAMVSVLFAMARDRELPRPLTRLNYSGVPWVALIASLLIPLAVIAVERDVTVLAQLYVLGVCGAITVSVGSCVLNRSLEISRGERLGMTALALFLGAITLTIGVTELVSTAFSGGLVALVLATRFALSRLKPAGPEPIPEPITGWLAEARAQPVAIDPDKPKIMLAARGRYQSEFAVDLARRRRATLFAIFVRTIRVIDMRPGQTPTIEEDAEAQQTLGSTGLIAKANGVPFVPIYVVATDIPGEILDHTVTYGCDTLIMGKSRRNLLSRRVQGDVVAQIAEHLPDEVALITRSADTPHAHALSMPEGV